MADALTAITPHDLPLERDFLHHSLERAVAEGYSDLSVDEIMSRIEAGRLTAWRRGGSLVVTQVVPKEGGYLCVLAYGTGDMDEIVSMTHDIEAKANEAGIQELLIIGRRGWLKALDGYEECYTAMRKRLWAVS